MTSYLYHECLYHSNHRLIYFCKCPECLLPLCDSCVKIHKNEHQMYNSKIQNQKVQNIYQQVRNIYEKLISSIAQIQKSKQMITFNIINNQQIVKQMFRVNKQKIIKNFQQALISAQQAFLNDLYIESNKIVKMMQQIDTNIICVNQELKLKLFEINQNPPSVWKSIISFYTQNEQLKYQNQIKLLKLQVSNLQQKRLNIDSFNFDKINKYFINRLNQNIKYKQIYINT